MKFTLSWLKDHLDTQATAEEIGDVLTNLGLELEGLENKAEELAPFKVAYVKEAAQHPNADRLKVCTVDPGDGSDIQVICGAPNAKTGMKGVFAPVGSYIPGIDTTLKAGKIRGVESNGMLVSEREMGISDEHEGIIELDADAPVGEGFAKVMGLDDPVFDIAITPNRADCLGVRGVARDLAAAGLGTLKEDPRLAAAAGSYEPPLQWKRDLPAGAQGRLPLRRRPALPRAQERREPGVAAAAPARDRAAADLRAGGHHQLRHLRPRPAAARVRRRQGDGRPHHASGA